MFRRYRLNRLTRKRDEYQATVDRVRELQRDPDFAGLGPYGMKNYMHAWDQVEELTERIEHLRGVLAP